MYKESYPFKTHLLKGSSNQHQHRTYDHPNEQEGFTFKLLEDLPFIDTLLNERSLDVLDLCYKMQPLRRTT